MTPIATVNAAGDKEGATHPLTIHQITRVVFGVTQLTHV